MKCPINNFKECYGSECEWYIANKGLCSVALIASNLNDLGSISSSLDYQKNLEEYKKFDQ